MDKRVSVPRIPNQRAVIDRRRLAAAIAEAVAGSGAQKARPRIVELLRAALEGGREELTRRLAAHPSAGHEIAHGHAFLADQLIRGRAFCTPVAATASAIAAASRRRSITARWLGILTALTRLSISPTRFHAIAREALRRPAFRAKARGFEREKGHQCSTYSLPPREK